jgi:hypothetical protein
MRGRIIGGVVAVALLGCADAQAPSEPEYAVPIYENRQNGDHGRGHDVFVTDATGAEEVPARDTRAQGHAWFKLNRDGTLSYRLLVRKIENVTQAHIHVAPFGQNGGVVVWLYPSAPPAQLIPGESNGVLGAGTIEDGEVVGSLAGLGVAALLEQIRAGNTYVNVHTTLYPGGEIRGQID